MKKLNIIKKMSNHFVNVFILCVLVAPFSGYADEFDDDEEDRPTDFSVGFDFKQLDGVTQRLKPHDNGLMGDVVDKKTGNFSLQNTDISIPGNSNLEVALRRTYEQGDIRYSQHQQAFGDWDLDLPIAYASYGYNIDTNHPEFNNGCLTSANDLFKVGDIHVDNQQIDSWVPSTDHNNGWALSIPGKGLSGFQGRAGLSDPKSNWVSGGQGTDHAGRCAQITIAPDGTKYKFGLSTFRAATEMSFPVYFQERLGPEIRYGWRWLELTKRYATLLITEIEDIHGNWVRYEYDGNNQLEKIHSNDAREINIYYNNSVTTLRNSKPITHITANNRTWYYTNGNGGSLTKVTLPDGRYWAYGLESSDKPMYAMRRPLYRSRCTPINWTFTMKHPDGAIGDFTLRETRHIQNVLDYEDLSVDGFTITAPSGEPLVTTLDQIDYSYCYGGYSELGDEPGEKYLKEFSAMSLVEKTISAPDIPDATWKYSYRRATDKVSAAESESARITWTTIIGPNNVEKTYVYHAIGENHGLLKRVHHDDLTSFEYEYDLSQERDSNCYGAGDDEFTGTCFNYVKRPQTKIIRTSDSVAYTTEKEYEKSNSEIFIDYGLPNKIKKYSSLQSEQRITEIEYWHNTSNNIIGLKERIVNVNNDKEFMLYGYDSKGSNISKNRFGALRESYTYHADGNLKNITEHVTSTKTHTAKLENYYRGQPRKITRRDGGVLLRTVDANGWVTSETNALGYHTTYGYNDAGWMTSIGRPFPWNDTTITYSNLGTTNFYSTEVQGTNQNVVWYDAMLRPTLEKKNPTSGVGITVYVKTEYDALGRVIFSSQPSFSSNPTQGINTTYDALGRVINTAENFSPYVSSLTEYLSNNRVRVTDPLGNQTITTRSGYASPNDGNTTLIQSPEGVNTAMTFDIYGNMLTTTQSGGGVSSTQRWFYDNNLRLCRHYVPETGSKLFQYNNIDQVTAYSEGQSYSTSCTTPSANKVSLTYDAVGRLLTTNFPSPTPDIIRDYDLNGNLKEVNRGTSQWYYTYFDNNQLETEELSIDGLNFNTSYTRNGNGALSGIGYPSGDYVSFSPDGFGRATKALASNSDYSGVYANSVQYHPNDSLNTFEYGNGVQFSQTLNIRQLPAARNATVANGQDPMKLNYSYDYLGNVTHITDGVDSSRNITNSFDGLSRLKTSNSGRGNFTFNYDALGNLHSRTVIGGSALGGPQHAVNVTFNTLNQVKTATNLDGTKTFVHDTRGNVTSNGTHNFVYDYANQPTSISGGQSGSFTYDGNLKRVKQVVDGKTIYSVYTQEAGLISQYNKTTSTHTDHIRVAGTTVARVESKGSQADSSTTAFDVQTAPSSASGNLSDRPHYLPFGKQINGLSAKENAIGYTGHIEDSSGLVYMQARYYDPVIGRFYSNDPVGWVPRNPVHSFGRYTYANNNPYKYTDPTGMEGEDSYKNEVQKPILKDITVKIDLVVTMENPDGSTTSTSTDGTTSDTASTKLDELGPISFGASKDKATGETTHSVALGKQLGPDELNVTPSVSADSNGNLTGAVQLNVSKAGIAVQAQVPASGIVHNIKTIVSQARDILTTSPSGN